jgi:hypothetical protein
MGSVPYVGFATYHPATMKVYLYFKRLMFMQMFCIKKKGRHNPQEGQLLHHGLLSTFPATC